ncbi:MAG: hypothetical protein AVDCRST_MAG19-1025 [uncultured Thermomicrobiales bacterium]|uniref:Uncharacterized protein n=1 Tax=uncultured Thermomicrobiales bacterium TaxID=1645740 RepID=A0A6J4UL28_9BACT|nr:MAG: hypothetical protein AVDCRST_MAG19-1025 [uncultured Thermomicrobiales bacterium]
MNRSGGRPARSPIGASRWQGPLFLLLGLSVVVNAWNDDQPGIGGLLRLILGSMLLTGGGAALVPASGRTAVLGWALRIAQLFFIVVAIAVVGVWLFRR